VLDGGANDSGGANDGATGDGGANDGAAGDADSDAPHDGGGH
jgi:hypothetical protein